MPQTQVNTKAPIDAGVRIGHVHLKVSDLERAVAFYSDILGFEVTQRFGAQAAFLSAGGSVSSSTPGGAIGEPLSATYTCAPS